MTGPTDSQSTSTVLMVRPVRFQSNPQTASSNAFQGSAPALAPVDIQKGSLREFEELVDALTIAGVRVLVVEDTPEPHKPDAIFPNNWFSTHADGTVVLYPMLAENRRAERRPDVIDALQKVEGFAISRIIDIAASAGDGEALEGTGSLVLDRVNRVAFACMSPRTSPPLLASWGERLGYRVIAFTAVDSGGRPIYHTNVMMSIGDHFAIVCLESIRDGNERSTVEKQLRDTGHEIVPITLQQVAEFAGNMLQLYNSDGERLLVMSQRARDALTEEQAHTLEKYAHLVSSPIGIIEDCSGGSVRCMLAEIFLAAMPANQQ